MKLNIQPKQRHRARFSCTDRWISIAVLGLMAYLVYSSTAGSNSLLSPATNLCRALAFRMPQLP